MKGQSFCLIIAIILTTICLLVVAALLLAMRLGTLSYVDRVYWQLMQSVVIINQIYILILAQLLNTFKIAYIQLEASTQLHNVKTILTRIKAQQCITQVTMIFLALLMIVTPLTLQFSVHDPYEVS